MSKRRNAGEIVVKNEHAGFVGSKLVIRIPTLATFIEHGFSYKSVKEDQDQCMMSCGDDQCVEYANVEVLDEKNDHSGWCYHVSECQMSDKE